MKIIKSHKDYVVLDRNKKTYLFSGEDNSIFEFPVSEIDNIDEFLKKRNKKIRNTFTNKKKHPLMFSLLLTQSCNLRCRYCYEKENGDSHFKNKYMSNEVLEKILESIFELSKENKRVSICFFGGEPLVNIEGMRLAVYHIEKFSKKYSVKAGLSMTSNGTLFNNQVNDFITNNRIKVQISIDGDQKTNDFNRYYLNGKGAFNNAISKTAKLRNLLQLNARATITPYNLDLVSIYKSLHDLKFNQIMLSPAFNYFEDESSFNKLAEGYTDLFSYELRNIKNSCFLEVRQNKMFMQLFKRIHFSKKIDHSCGIGRNLFAIDVDGSIYPCQRFVGEYDFRLGNINDITDLSELKKVDYDTRNEKCEVCWARNLCLGGCSHENYLATGSMNSHATGYCNYFKKIALAMVDCYLSITQEELKELLS